MPRPSRRDGDSPTAHRRRSRSRRRRRREETPPRSRSPRDRVRPIEHVPAPPPAMEPRGEEQVTCAICLVGYQVGEETAILTCAHEYHMACIQRWMEESATCPMCRAPIPQPDRRIQFNIANLIDERFETEADEHGDVWYIIGRLFYRFEFYNDGNGIMWFIDFEELMAYRFDIGVDESGNTWFTNIEGRLRYRFNIQDEQNDNMPVINLERF